LKRIISDKGYFSSSYRSHLPFSKPTKALRGGIKFGRQNYQLFHEGFLASSGILKYEGKEIDRKVI
jgi:hypothetical protein